MLSFLKHKLFMVLVAIFHRNRLDSSGNVFQPTGLEIITSRFNQSLMEKGWSPPWICSAEACVNFWSMQVNQNTNANEPQQYSNKSRKLIEFLQKYWQSHVRPEFSVLELGCNSGANLETLRVLGYTKLASVEINAEAVALMSRVFPDLYKDIDLNVGSLEDTLPLLSTDSYDVVFTMAVLMHVHPTSSFIFSEMARISSKYVVTVEPEFANASYVFARNYRRVFQKLGCKQLSCVRLGIDYIDADIADYHGITLRIFSVPTSKGDGVDSSCG